MNKLGDGVLLDDENVIYSSSCTIGIMKWSGPDYGDSVVATGSESDLYVTKYRLIIVTPKISTAEKILKGAILSMVSSIAGASQANVSALKYLQKFTPNDGNTICIPLNLISDIKIVNKLSFVVPADEAILTVGGQKVPLRFVTCDYEAAKAKRLAAEIRRAKND